MVNVNELANYIILLAEKKGIEITQLQLHKIMFFLQLKNINENNSLLFNEEFQAWRHGPVLISQRNRFRKFGSENIKIAQSTISADTVNQLKFLDEFIIQLLRINPWALVESSHQNKFWIESLRMNSEIKNSDLLEYYGG